MKNYIKLSLISLSLVGMMTSCDMDAPTQSTVDASTVFSQYSLAEQEVMSIHISFCETNSYRGRFIPYYGLNSDLEVGSGTYPSLTSANNEKQQLWNYNTPANNTQMNTDNNAYGKFYEGIERANLAIEGIRKYGNPENNKDMAQLLGEALTLRAVTYNDLLKGWGDVPARFKPNDATTVYLPRTNRDVIYKQLLADLKEAEDYCYWPNESQITKSTERVSKSFVKGLRARIALYAGGYGLRGDGYRKSNDPDLETSKMYEIAKEECLDVINSGRNKLGDFKDNFTKLCQDNVTAGDESLWEIPFSDGRGRVLYTFGVKHGAKDQYTSQAQGGVNGPIPYLYYDYDSEDIRRDITCVPYEWSKELTNGKSHQQLRGINKWCFGKLRYEWMKSDRALSLGAQDDGINWQYMRLADVYLMAAEAINALDGPVAAWPYMKPVLDRVLPAEKVAALQTKYTASKDAFFNGIVEQRAFEFAGESLRKADLIRWGIIDEKMAEAKEKLTRLANRTGEYADLPLKLYYKLGTDGETLSIYGLNHGDTDEQGEAMTKDDNNKYSSKQWFVDSKTGLNVIDDDYINGLYVKQPSLNCLWPIWQTFIDKSNGLLNNDGNYGQLSE
jgi:hypothetical protein